MFGAMAGGLFAVYQQESYPEMLYWTANAQPVVVALLGGTGSFLGPALGAFVYTVLDNWVTSGLPSLVSGFGADISNQVGQLFDLILGAIVLLIVLVTPGGLSSLPALFIRLRSRYRGEKPAVEEESSGSAMEEADLSVVSQIEAVQADHVLEASDLPLLSITGLSKSFGGLRAVQDVNLSVRTGDRHATIGPNGRGKSTLFNLITGRLRPDHGKVLFAGKDITGKPPHEIARAGIGRAFQITTIFPKLTVLQNLQYALLAHRGLSWRPWGVANQMFRDECMVLLEAVGLSRQHGLPAGQLSHGDQRAIEIAISLAL